MATHYIERELVYGIYETVSISALRPELDSGTISCGDPAEIVILVLSDGLGVGEILPVIWPITDELSIIDDCWPYAWGGLRTKYLSDERYKERRTYPKTI